MIEDEERNKLISSLKSYRAGCWNGKYWTRWTEKNELEFRAANHGLVKLNEMLSHLRRAEKKLT